MIYGLNMQVRRGDFVYLIGKVGSGKTSIIRSIIAENRLGGGSGRIYEYDLSTLREKDIPFLRRKIGIVFQDFQLLMDRSIQDNLDFVLQATEWKDENKRKERICEVLELVGMGGKLHKKPHQLSGGEQQRIAIARALLNSPELIVADEPTGNLDNETSEVIMHLLSGINQEQGTAIIMVTHHPQISERYPGRIFLCYEEECTEQERAL